MLESDFRLTTHHLICPGRFDEFRVRFEIMEHHCDALIRQYGENRNRQKTFQNRIFELLFACNRFKPASHGLTAQS